MRKLIGLLLVVLVAMLGASIAGGQSIKKGGVEYLFWGNKTWEQPRTFAQDTLTTHGMTPINVLGWGVTGDGTTDDTDSLAVLIDSMGAWGGGIAYFPYTGNNYLANITLDEHNITLMGESWQDNQSIACFVEPADTSLPVLTIGDGSTLYRGIGLLRMGFTGNSRDGDEGIKIQGAYKCLFRGVVSQGFKKYALRLIPNPSVQNEYLWFDGCMFSDADSATVDVRDYRDLSAGAKTEAIFFNNTNINSNSGAMALDLRYRAEVWLSNTWIHGGGSEAGVEVDSLSTIYMSNVMIEAGSSSNVVVNFNAYNYWDEVFHGFGYIDGVAKWPSDSTATFTGKLFGYQSTFRDPMVAGTLYFADAMGTEDPTADRDSLDNLYAWDDSVSMVRSAAVFTIEAQDAEIDINPGVTTGNKRVTLAGEAQVDSGLYLVPIDTFDRATNAAMGVLYFDEQDSVLYIHNGTEWLEISTE